MLYLETDDGAYMVRAEQIQKAQVNRQENKITVSIMSANGQLFDQLAVKFTEANVAALRAANEPRPLSVGGMTWNNPVGQEFID